MGRGDRDAGNCEWFQTELGMPTPLGQPLVDLVRLYDEVDLRGAYLYLGPTWESLGADGYVLARLLWDPCLRERTSWTII